MSEILGNEEIIRSFLAEFPPVSLLTGPPSIGKRRVAEAAITAQGYAPADVLIVNSLGVPEARKVIRFLETSSTTDKGSAVLISLDSSLLGADVLLKSLEDIPEHVRVVMVASRPIPETLESRAVVYRFGYLAPDDVILVMKKIKKGLSEGFVSRLVGGFGNIENAMDGLKATADKALVLSAVRAVNSRDVDLLALVSKEWRTSHTELLVSWAIEATSGRPRLFTATEIEDAGTLPLRLLQALRFDIRTRFVLSAVLPSLM